MAETKKTAAKAAVKEEVKEVEKKEPVAKKPVQKCGTVRIG